jgi:enterochelin esterase-like enzyme
MLTFLLSVLATYSSASVIVRKTNQGPTGYEIDFKYVNANVSSVIIAGGIKQFTDQYHTSPQYSANYDPHDYHPGDFFVSLSNSINGRWPYVMKDSGSGVWTFTTPLPSGTYNYAFYTDCPTADCNITSGLVIDPDNPPFLNVAGDQVASTFQVPYDEKFQYYASLDLNFDYALPSNSSRGSVKTVNYTSPGSSHPGKDIHDFSIYLPAEYGTVSNKKYPLLYLSHGGGGNGQDWENLAKASHIFDNLIARGHIEPTVVVMPTFYNLFPGGELIVNGSATSPFSPSAQDVRANYIQYLFPWVQANFNVSTDPRKRAFAGLSLGGILTYEMYLNATDYFGYFGLFSGARGPGQIIGSYLNASMVAQSPGLGQKGIFLSAGLYDIAFEDVRGFQSALDEARIGYMARYTPWGSHYWNTWQDALWTFGVTSLWKPTPFTTRTGRIP